MIPFSVLDLSPIPEGSTAAESLRRTADLAQRAEAWGYRRFWLAEHHNMTGIASAATAVVIGHVAEKTRTIRVGSGGIMLPNHSPLVIAEQFGTLASLYPGRIDLGLGRAPGTDPVTARALRRDPAASADRFPQDVLELQRYFRPAAPGQAIRAVPGEGLEVPLWLLGSSLFSAELAAALGLPFAFASHFAPTDLLAALEVYRANFRPSSQLEWPYAMPALNVMAADTEAEARRQFTSRQLATLNLRRGRPGPVPPPVDDLDSQLTPEEKALLDHQLRYSAVGAPAAVASAIRAFIEATQADELIITTHTFDHAARLRSFELVAGLRPGLAEGKSLAVPGTLRHS
ncbi:MAG TPA: LLM class flavin-dependent oxidoreductase [Opitutaceae bacterium]|nr:LLM class flavin-dependent oxidoreductase [Opitutaceae bacterium]